MSIGLSLFCFCIELINALVFPENESWNEKEAKNLFQTLPFHNVLIEKPDIKKLSNKELLHELPFCDELSIPEVSKAFKRYARSYKVEVVDHKDLLIQLEASRSSIKDLFKDLSDEIKCFKYQITVAVLLGKENENGDIEYSSVYFNSTIKTVINSELSLDKCFQEILYRIDNWIIEGSGWIIESIKGKYVNISMYSPLIRSSSAELPNELKNPKKGLINIKNNDKKCFLWCHVRHLNLIKKHPERIKKDKKLANNLNYEGIEFPIS